MNDTTAAEIKSPTNTAFDNLLDGYRRFRSGPYAERSESYKRLAEDGQSPHVMVIGCCDSRADPALIFDAKPGELFVVRNVANLVPPYEPHGNYHGTSAAIEFAVSGLGVKVIMVLGHGRCGGIRAFLEGPSNAGISGMFIGKWMSMISATRVSMLRTHGDANLVEQGRVMEHSVIGASLNNLYSFPFVRAAVDGGQLELRGGWFGISEGVLYLRQDDGSFAPAVDG